MIDFTSLTPAEIRKRTIKHMARFFEMDDGKITIARESRECGSCTACCTTMPVIALDKGENEPCENLCSLGCGVYADRPDACSGFECSWLQGFLKGDERRRPDNLGVMFFTMKTIAGVHLAAWELKPGILKDQSTAAYQIVNWLAEVQVVLVFRFAENEPSMRSFIGPKPLMREVMEFASKQSGVSVSSGPVIQLGGIKP